MSRSRLPLCVFLLALMIVAIAPAAALGDAYQQVVGAYARTGAIPPCRFSSSTLESALKNAPTYDVEYFGDFTAAVQATLSEQASGSCARPSSAVSGPVPGLTAPQRVADLPRSVTAGGGAAVPLPLLLGLIAALAGLLGTAGVVGSRRLGWAPRWSATAGHAWAEAEYRMSGTWAEFRDWLSARP